MVESDLMSTARPPRGPGGRTGHGRRRGRAEAGGRRGDGRLWLWGRHAVTAALAHADRACFRLLATRAAIAGLGPLAHRPHLEVREAEAAELARRIASDAAHQGLLLEVGPLPPRALDELTGTDDEPRLLLALDQVSDPRNLGAILRSAAALGVGGVVVPRHGSAELGGACAKAASGALDRVPIAEVVNLARALAELRERGFAVLGLDASGPLALEQLPLNSRTVLVLGAEGTGLRRLTAERCDTLARLAIDPGAESLNVAVAAGVALYVIRHALRPGLAGPTPAF